MQEPLLILSVGSAGSSPVMLRNNAAEIRKSASPSLLSKDLNIWESACIEGGV